MTADVVARARPDVCRRRDPLVRARYRLLSHDLDAPVRRVTGLEAPRPYSHPLENLPLSAPGAIAAALRAAGE